MFSYSNATKNILTYSYFHPREEAEFWCCKGIVSHNGEFAILVWQLLKHTDLGGR